MHTLKQEDGLMPMPNYMNMSYQTKYVRGGGWQFKIEGYPWSNNFYRNEQLAKNTAEALIRNIKRKG
jgi:hypothetical protein